MKKELVGYNVKSVETPVTLEVWEYCNNPVIYSINAGDSEKNRKDQIEKNEESKKEIASEYYDKVKRKQKHYEAMRWQIARIVDCNFDENTKFVTLTFKENIQDIAYTNTEFEKFIKRFNYKLYHVKKAQLKYLAVWERQKRGAIHYHVIFFDLPYVKNKDLQRYWGQGFVKINKVDVDSKENRGRYVSKYFSKDIDEKEYKQKAFFKSQKLKMPIVTHKYQDEMQDFSDSTVVYTKEYTRRVPDFYTPSGTGGELQFKESVVRYTKIRKDNKNELE